MVTFADLMALLLTLFVLLLSFSEMDVIRFKSIVGSLKQSTGFSKDTFERGVVQEDGTIIGKAIRQASPDVPRISQSLPPPQAPKVESTEGISEEDAAENVAGALQQQIDKLQGTRDVRVRQEGRNVIVRFPNHIAFTSGAANINDAFAAILNRITPVLAQVQNAQFAIAGHTDNVPLGDTSIYPSNWELSAARATSVVHWLTENQSLDPGLFTVQGFGDSRPLADNANSDGRAENRRVELIVLIDSTPKAGDDTILR